MKELVKSSEVKNDNGKECTLKLITKVGDITNVGKALRNFPIENGFDYTYKAEQMVLTLNKLYKNTKVEIKGLFTINEAWLIAICFNGFLYTTSCNDKESLIREINAGIYYEAYDEMYGVDRDKLLKKINNLEQLESFTVIRMALEFWNLQKINVDGEELITEIFGIE